MHRLKIAGFATSVPAPEKRPAFHRRIRDNLVFAIELPNLHMLQYATVVKITASTIYSHVWEWME
jgi:hypothetical protein